MPPSKTHEVPFIVGVGASAGGLEALSLLLGAAKPENGVAYVIVQHLSPDYESNIVELLDRITQLSVHWATNGEVVEAGSAYVIRPQTTLTIFEGKLVVAPHERGTRMHLPVDSFLQSLAQDQGANTAAAILSGAGSDGSRGCRAIKEMGGFVIAQTAESSDFDGMPRAIRTAGLADLVLPPGEMATALFQILSSPGGEGAVSADGDNATTATILHVLQKDRSLNLGYYKRSTVLRRLQRRVRILGLTAESYAAKLERDKDERARLAKDMLIGVTRFFRDPEAFDALGARLRQYLDACPPETTFRAWVAGCSTGEEAYSVAIAISEAIADTDPTRPFRVFATDVNHDSLRWASHGSYSASSVADIPPSLRVAYLERHANGTFLVKQSLRDRLLFSRHDVLQDPPFSGLDLVVCRNVMIYLRSPVQARVSSHFGFALRSGGLLLLGPSETIIDHEGEFELLDSKWHLFRSRGLRHVAQQVEAQESQTEASHGRLSCALRRDIELLDVFQRILPVYAPPFVVVNDQLELIYRSGNLRGLLAIPEGRATLDCHEMFPDELTTHLAKFFEEMRDSTSARRRDLSIHTPEGTLHFDLRIDRIEKSLQGKCLYALTFEGLERGAQDAERVLDAGEYDARARVLELKQQLNASKENLRSSVEALETSTEELQSTNEELLASNEELQSLNSELQNVNEQLHSVNAEYQVKIEELSRLNNDMDQLLGSIDIGAIFLDGELTIRRFNPPAARFVNLLTQDVGRPLKHLNHEFHESLEELCQKALLSPEPIERLLLTLGGCKVVFHAREISPQSDGTGLVVTFTDVTSVHAERETRQMLDEALQGADIAMAIVDAEGRLSFANRAFAEQFDRDPKWLPGLDITLLTSEQEREHFRGRLGAAASGIGWQSIIASLRANGEVFQELIRLTPLRNEEGTPVGILRLTEAAYDLGTVTGASLTGTFAWDIRTDDTHCSLSLFEVLGLDPSGPPPNMESFYPLIVDDDREAVDRHLATAMDSTIPYEYSFRAKRPDGRVQRIGCRMLPDRKVTGELSRIVGVMWVVPEPLSQIRELSSVS